MPHRMRWRLKKGRNEDEHGREDEMCVDVSWWCQKRKPCMNVSDVRIEPWWAPAPSSHRLSRMRRVDSVRKDNGNESNQKTLKYHQPKRREKPPIDLSSAHFSSYLPSCAFIILSPDASKSLLRCRCWAPAKDIYFDRAQTVCPVRVADRLGWPLEGVDSRSLHQIDFGGWWFCLQRQLPSMTSDWTDAGFAWDLELLMFSEFDLATPAIEQEK